MIYIYTHILSSVLDWSIPILLGISCLNLLLSMSHWQGQKVATCLFITSPRSSEMQSSCKCSCLLATSSLPKSLWTERLIRANVLVSKMDCRGKKIHIQSSLAYLWCRCITLSYCTHNVSDNNWNFLPVPSTTTETFYLNMYSRCIIFKSKHLVGK